MPPLVRSVEIEVRYVETDQMGVVHHSNYLVWFELARTRLCEESGFHYAEIERRGYLLTVSRVALAYRRSARYGDVVDVSCRVDRQGSRGIRFAYEVHRDEELLADGTTDHLWLDRESGRPCRLPGFLREPFRALGASTPRSS